MSVEQPNSKKRHRKLELPNGSAEVWLQRAGSRVAMHIIHPSGTGHSNWDVCDVDGCLGEAVTPSGRCVLHAEPESRAQYLSTLPGSNKWLSARGVAITPQLFRELLASPHITDSSTKSVKVAICLSGAEITAQMDFDDTTFDKFLELNCAIIREPGRLSVRNCTFRSNLSARFVFFDAGPPAFNNCTFKDSVDISYAHAQRVSIGFANCTFSKAFDAGGLVATLSLERCRCESDLTIRDAKAEMLLFDGLSVAGVLDVAHTSCVCFRAPHLQAFLAYQVGPLEVGNDCDFSHAQFNKRVHIDVRANDLMLAGAQLLEGGHITVGRARVNLKQLSAGSSLGIFGAGDGSAQPKILTLEDADAGSMSFSNIDMSQCLFYGSHDLGDVVIEPTVMFASAPIRYYAKRRCIADEFAWRQTGGGFRASAWSLPGTKRSDAEHRQHAVAGEVVLPNLRASQVAAVYRDLRRSFEARSDEPGAEDFYYGEMEMRRHSEKAGWTEWAIVSLYWIISGYGLRAGRSLFWLATLIIISGVIMAWAGFDTGTKGIFAGTLYCLRAPLPGAHSDVKLTAVGDVVDVVVRVLAPVLFALALLAVRGQVKR